MFIDKVDLFRSEFHINGLCVLDSLICVAGTGQRDGNTGPFNGPAEHQLRKRGILTFRQRFDQAEKCIDPCDIVRLVEFGTGAMVAIFKLMIRFDLPGKDAALQGAVSEDALAVFYAVGRQFFFDIALHHTERHLVGSHWQYVFRTLHLPLVIVANTGFTDLSLFFKTQYRFEAFLYRGGFICPVDLVKIDVIRAETTKAVLTLPDDVLFSGIFMNVMSLPLLSLLEK